MKKQTLWISLIILLFVSCNGQKTTQQDHQTEQTIDWSGTYYGILPCASCPGIKTLITLTDDFRFEKNTEYIGENDEPETIRGTFTWSEDGEYIVLDNQHYKVGEAQLTMLDSNNQEVKGELAADYVLKKTELADCSDLDEGYSLYDYKDANDIKYTILYNTNLTPPTAIVESDTLKLLLTQTTAWAKGAEYEDENGNKIIAKEDSIKLLIGKKQIELKPQW